MATTDYSPNSLGRVVQVIGPVVDVAFDSAELPEINTALLLTNKSIDGLVTRSAVLISGSSAESKATSTTGPMTWTTRPMLLGE